MIISGTNSAKMRKYRSMMILYLNLFLKITDCLGILKILNLSEELFRMKNGGTTKTQWLSIQQFQQKCSMYVYNIYELTGWDFFVVSYTYAKFAQIFQNF